MKICSVLSSVMYLNTDILYMHFFKNGKGVNDCLYIYLFLSISIPGDDMKNRTDSKQLISSCNNNCEHELPLI